MLSLYHVAMSTIQRDTPSESMHDTLSTLRADMDQCVKRIYSLITDRESHPHIETGGSRELIEEAKEYVSDGMCFIDKLVDM